MRKLIKGDEVIVITGRDKGKTGVIDKVISDSFIIKGVNLSKKHQKPNPNKGVAGGIVQIELPIHRSNIAIYNKSKKLKDLDGLVRLAWPALRCTMGSRWSGASQANLTGLSRSLGCWHVVVFHY